MKLAIIGNSADVSCSERGSLIDNCDLVIRVNSFRTSGFEKWVGSRTDIVSICLAPWVVANALATARAALSQVRVVWTPSWRGHAFDDEVANAMLTIGHKPEALIFSDDSGHHRNMQALYDEFFARAEARPGEKTQAHDGKKLLPTTGFLTVHLARLRYPSAKILIKGFGLEGPFNLERFDQSGVKMWPGHDILTERSWFLEGEQEGEWEIIR
jgi:hypothetical protein